MLSVIIPASNEADYIGPCLSALFSGMQVAGGAEVIVVVNGCRDDTATRARAMRPTARQAGWRLTVLERAEGGKPGALNAGDGATGGAIRMATDGD